MASKNVNYEDLLELTGGFGRYQFFYYIWLLATTLHNAASNAYMVFGGITPEVINCTTQLEENKTLYTKVEADNETTCFRYQYESLVYEWDLTGPRKYIASQIISLQMAGMFIGPWLFGRLSDRFGRKTLALAAISFTGLTALLCAVSVNWQMFAVARFFSGIAVGGMSTSESILSAETMVQRWRLITYFLGPMVGYLFLGFLAGVVTNNWRYLLLYGTAPVLVTFPICFFFILESPKFLLQRNRKMDAYLALEKISAWNNVCCQKELSAAIDSYHHADKRHEIWYVFKHRKLTLQTLVLAFSWIAAACVYYGLLFNLNNVKGSVVVNYVTVMLIRIVVSSSIAMVDRYVDKMGRRHLHQSGLGIVALCMSLMTVFVAVDHLRVNFPLLARIPALAGCGFCSFLWCAIDMYSAEMYPTTVRGAAYGSLSTVARFGSMLSPQICLLTFLWVPGPYVVFLAIIVVNMLLAYVWLPETKGKPLPDFGDAEVDSAKRPLNTETGNCEETCERN